MKKYIVPVLGTLAVTVSGAFAQAATVTDAIDGLETDAGLGVAAGLGIGVILFGARVVWRAVKGMAK